MIKLKVKLRFIYKIKTFFLKSYLSLKLYLQLHERNFNHKYVKCICKL